MFIEIVYVVRNNILEYRNLLVFQLKINRGIYFSPCAIVVNPTN